MMGPNNVLPTLPHLAAAENNEEAEVQPVKNDIFSALGRRRDARKAVIRGLLS
jgi:hypothetical protein